MASWPSLLGSCIQSLSGILARPYMGDLSCRNCSDVNLSVLVLASIGYKVVAGGITPMLRLILRRCLPVAHQPLIYRIGQQLRDAIYRVSTRASLLDNVVGSHDFQKTVRGSNQQLHRLLIVKSRLYLTQKPNVSTRRLCQRIRTQRRSIRRRQSLKNVQIDCNTNGRPPCRLETGSTRCSCLLAHPDNLLK